MANALDITIYQGSDFQRLLTIKSDNVLVDLTGSSFRAKARVKFNDVAAAFVFSFVIDPDQTANRGQVMWKLVNTALDSLQMKSDLKYLYDVEMVSAGGIVTQILRGVATVKPNVTK